MQLEQALLVHGLGLAQSQVLAGRRVAGTVACASACRTIASAAHCAFSFCEHQSDTGVQDISCCCCCCCC